MTFIPLNIEIHCFVACSEEKIKSGQCHCNNRVINKINIKMEKYIGVKILESAKLMTRKEYCDYRGWTVPEDEDPNEEVYLVEYEVTEDNKSNHPDHKGYISMSPKDVFEAAYVRENILTKGQNFGEEHQKRVMVEAEDLNDKLQKLKEFQNSDIFKGLHENESSLLNAQAKTMSCYLSILVKRMTYFEPTE